MIETWLVEDNLRPFLETVGGLIDHDFDEEDWVAVSEGIRGTDSEAHRWYEYEFYKGIESTFEVAFDCSGSHIVRFRADLPSEFGARICLLGDFCARYYWRRPDT